MWKVLFVCTANTCRSPLAESLFRSLAANFGLVVDVKSAGIFANSGSQMSQHSAYLLRERGIEPEFHSQRVDDHLMAWADLILTMTESHKGELLRRYPETVNKCFTLKEYVLHDEQLEQIYQEMNRIFAEIEMQFSLGQAVTDEQRQSLRELEKKIPDMNIADPFAGSVDMYRECSLEIERHLQLLINKLQKEKV